MDDELKKKITEHYRNEYFQKIAAGDNSFLRKFQKFTTRHESACWGVAGLGITAVVVSVAVFSVGAVVWVPAVAALMIGISATPAIHSSVDQKNFFAATEKIRDDIESGILLERYRTEVLQKKSQQQPSAELTKLETKIAAEQFEAAAKKEQEEEKSAEAVAEDRLKKLKASQPPKTVLK